MAKETINYDELNKLIDSYKEDRPQKKALLVFKSSCEPFRGKEIPVRKANLIMTTRVDAEELLAKKAFDEEDEVLFEFFSHSAEKLGNVIQILYKGDE